MATTKKAGPRDVRELADRVRRAGTKVGFVTFGTPDIEGLIDVTAKARASFSPFASVSCGDVLALFRASDDALKVVVLGAHGEAPRVFVSVDAFVASWAARKTGVPDLDQDEGGASTAERAKLLGAEGRGAPPSVAASRAMTAWLKANAPKSRGLGGEELERIRAGLEKLVKREAGKLPSPHTWTPRDVYCTFRIHYTRVSGLVEWGAGGMKPFPDPAIVPLIESLARVYQPNKPTVVINLASDGTLFPDARTTVRKP